MYLFKSTVLHVSLENFCLELCTHFTPRENFSSRKPSVNLSSTSVQGQATAGEALEAIWNNIFTRTVFVK